CRPCVPTWILASAQSTSSPFIQIFSSSCMEESPLQGWAGNRILPRHPVLRIPRLVLNEEKAGFRPSEPQQLVGWEADDVSRGTGFQPHGRERQERAFGDHTRALKRERG